MLPPELRQSGRPKAVRVVARLHSKSNAFSAAIQLSACSGGYGPVPNAPEKFRIHDLAPRIMHVLGDPDLVEFDAHMAVRGINIVKNR